MWAKRRIKLTMFVAVKRLKAIHIQIASTINPMTSTNIATPSFMLAVWISCSRRLAIDIYVAQSFLSLPNILVSPKLKLLCYPQSLGLQEPANIELRNWFKFYYFMFLNILLRRRKKLQCQHKPSSLRYSWIAVAAPSPSLLVVAPSLL